ncbi:MAG: DUF3806 domain-containing protein [Gammaproteobacteria bacterium]
MRVLAALLLCVGGVTAAHAYQPQWNFEPDQTAQQTAAQHAREMVQFARVELNLKLDWSDASIARIEEVASDLHADLRRERAPFREIETLVDMLGSYVGEVFRRNHGGEWGFALANGRRIMAVKAPQSGTMMWPIERIKQRVRGGGNHNVWAYYRARTALATQD